MGRSRYDVISPHPHFLTCTVIEWIPIFSKPQLVQIVLDSLTFLQQQQRLQLYGYVVMENHLHLMAAAVDLATQLGRLRVKKNKRVEKNKTSNNF